MFTTYSRITDVKNPLKNISLTTLVDIIRNNPQGYIINEIRRRKSENDDSYKKLKMSLNAYTPFSTNYKKNKQSVTDVSGYIYLDIDNIRDPETTKKEIINKYGHLISLINLSVSGKGLTLLIPVQYSNTKDELVEDLYKAIHYIQTEIFIGYEFDASIKDLARGLFISGDDNLYYNPDAAITQIPDVSTIIVPEKQKKKTSGKGSGIKVKIPNTLPPIDEVLQNLKTQTNVDIENKIIDFNPIEFNKIFIPRMIPDGRKRTTYFSMVCALMRINPGVKDVYIISYINYINNNYAKPKMNYQDMIKHITSIIKQVKAGEIDVNEVVKTRIKKIHFAKDCGLAPEVKRTIARKINAKITVNDSINKIASAKKELEEQGKKITKKAVSDLSGVGLTTVKKHWDKEITDIYSEIGEVNNYTVVVKNIDEMMNEEIEEQWAAVIHESKLEADRLNEELSHDWTSEVEDIDIAYYDAPKIIKFQKARREDRNDDLFIEWM